MYRKIVEILHPDLDPDLTEAQKELFYHAVARLMDAGKLLLGRIASKEMKGSWLKLDIKVYLHE